MTKRARSNVPACFSALFAFGLLVRIGPFFRRPTDHHVSDFLSFAIHHRQLPPGRGWPGHLDLPGDNLCCAESLVVILAIEAGGINQAVAVRYVKKIVGHLERSDHPAPDQRVDWGAVPEGGGNELKALIKDGACAGSRDQTKLNG
jgi:hypothetical protein